MAGSSAASKVRRHPFNLDDATTHSGDNRTAALFDFYPYVLTDTDWVVVLQVAFLSVVVVALLMSTLFVAAYLILNLLV